MLVCQLFKLNCWKVSKLSVRPTSVVIHVGPPKTGTSAIQKWLVEHHNELKQQGIYYPVHWLDENGISSGHVHLLFDVPSRGVFHFNEDKQKKLWAEFGKSGCHTLLLSSEAFLRQLEVLADKLPEATFLGYIRNPLEQFESGYNQMIKRHGGTKTMSSVSNIKPKVLDRFQSFVCNYGTERLTLRFYGKEFFPNGSIVCDFLSALGIDIRADDEEVNSSYHYEAMEIKRWLNQYPLEQIQGPLDLALQRYNKGTGKFSLLKPEHYSNISRQIAEQVLLLCKGLPVSQLEVERFVRVIRDKPQPPYREQGLSDKSFSKMACYLATELGPYYHQLCAVIRSQKGQARLTSRDKLFMKHDNWSGRALKFVTLSFAHLTFLIKRKLARLRVSKGKMPSNNP